MTMSSVIGMPGVNYLPISPSEMVTNVRFIPVSERLGRGPGVLVDQIHFAAFAVNWEVIYSIHILLIDFFLNSPFSRVTTLFFTLAKYHLKPLQYDIQLMCCHYSG